MSYYCKDDYYYPNGVSSGSAHDNYGVLKFKLKLIPRAIARQNRILAKNDSIY
ncbi:MAG: hypothetical protein N4A62_09980 [Marinisporobacter sp.]|jgi:dTDP-D-glucose 4,6-dehydratase|nr:hypothetical protein [Marinisporobacter sp.]